MRPSCVVVLLVCGACGGLRTQLDAGSGGGTAATGGGDSSAGGGDSGSGGGTNGTGGGMTGTGGGTTGTGGGTTGTGGGLAMFQFASLSVPSAAGNSINGLGGRAGEIYAQSNIGRLLRSTGGGFTEIVGASLTGTGAGVYVAPDGAVFHVSTSQLGSCLANCSQGTSYTVQVLTSGGTAEAVCGRSSSEVYAIIEDNAFVARLWKWMGTTWVETVTNLGVKYPTACVVLPDGTVAIAGRQSVAFHLNGVTTVEVAASTPPLSANEAQNTYWYGLGLAGSKLWTAGSGVNVSVRDAPNSWQTTTYPGALGTAFAIGGTSGAEVLAAGSWSRTVRRFDGSTWVDLPALPTLTTVRAMFIAGPNEIYFGGGQSSFDPAVDKAFR